MAGPGTAVDRFRLLDVLGAGGNGTVHRALDIALGVEVALKLLARPDGVDVYRFKREFRAFGGVQHPNLVRLHDLFADDQQWFFTMELLRGEPFDRFVRPGGALDLDRLRAALYQLTDALVAIHRLGKVHRDLKPSNVLVEPDGRLVVLDYGLVTDVAVRPGERTHEGAIVGSPAYMSPEQTLDRPLGPATDWYSLGVMLYQALTGALPFDGPVLEQLRRRVDERPRPPRELVPTVEPALEALCLAMLERDPARRADGARVLATLGRTPSTATLAIATDDGAGALVGRDPELARLRAHLDAARAGQTALVLVTGPSGIGKTALVEAFLDGLDPREALVLRGRCHERESVPYQAIDGLVDALTSALVAEPAARQAALLPPDVAALARGFPTLTRVPAVAQARAILPRDADELRRRALRAFTELVWRLARGRTPVVFIDDLQWSDGDSTGALAEVLEQLAEVGVLALASCRQAPEARLRATLAGHAVGAVAVDELAVAPLAVADARRLGRRLGATLDATAAALAAESGGVPMFLVELARAAGPRADAATAPSLEALLARRLAALPADVRGLLEVCAIAGRPLPLDVAATVAEVRDPATALSRLRAERLARATPRGAALELEPFHDRIRAAVVAELPATQVRAVHAGLAEALAARAAAPASVLVDHWAAAGERSRAAALARTAAAEAEAGFGFHRAAELYRLALDTDALSAIDRLTLGRRRATCLASAGRLTEAIAAAAAVAAGADGRERRALRQLEAECRLRHGDHAGGLDATRAVLAEVGVRLPRGRLATLAALATARARARLRGQRVSTPPLSGPSPDELERIDLLWKTTTGLSFVAPLLGTLTQAYHLRHALAAGEPTRAARALCSELSALAATCAPDEPRLAALATRAQALVAACASPELDTVLDFYLGYAAHLHGRWRTSAEHAARMEERLRAVGGERWHATPAHIHRVAASWYLGDTATIVARLPRYLAEAEAQGDAHAHELLRVTRCNVYWLVRGQPAVARAMATEHVTDHGAGRTVEDDVPIHDYLRLQAHLHIELYEGDAAAASARVEGAWPAFERSLLARFRQMRIELNILRARAALAMALTARDRWLPVARAAAAALAAEDLPWSRLMATSVRACAAHLAGDDRAAATLLAETAAVAGSLDMGLLAAAARHRLATWCGVGDATTVTQALSAGGVADPAAMVRLHLPG